LLALNLKEWQTSSSITLSRDWGRKWCGAGNAFKDVGRQELDVKHGCVVIVPCGRRVRIAEDRLLDEATNTEGHLAVGNGVGRDEVTATLEVKDQVYNGFLNGD
jgi:hypothetical protein